MADTSGGAGELGTICKCATCKKDFYKSKGHVYKRDRYSSGGKFKYFCTWSCMREYDRTHEKKKKQKEATYY